MKCPALLVGLLVWLGLGLAAAAPPRGAPKAAPGSLAAGKVGKADQATRTGKASKTAGKPAAGKPAAGKPAAGKADKADKADKTPGKVAGKADKAAEKPARKPRKNGKNAKLCDYLTPIHEHEIIPGESASEIAGRYGVLDKDIKRWNPKLKSIHKIRDGQKLNICPVITPRERIREEHIVQKGESFASIARQYSLTRDELQSYQKGRLADPDKLSIGTTLIVWRDGEALRDFKPESQKGKLGMAAKLPPSKVYYIKRPDRVYGTRNTVAKLKAVFDRYAKKHRGHPVVMGDLSARGGGPLSGHVSHQDGRDVDLGWVFKKGKGSEKTFVYGNKDNIDVPRTWALVHELLKTNSVEFIFIDHDIQELLYEEAKKQKVSADKLSQWFQYPRPAARLYGIVRHWKGHADHMHVRFRKD